MRSLSKPESDNEDKWTVSWAQSRRWRKTVAAGGLLLAAPVLALTACSSSTTSAASSPSPVATSAPPSTPAASPPASAAPSPTSASATAISRSQAKHIAIGAVGGGTVIQIKTDHKGNVLVWEVDVTSNGVKHEVAVNATTGKIISNHVD